MKLKNYYPRKNLQERKLMNLELEKLNGDLEELLLKRQMERRKVQLGNRGEMLGLVLRGSIVLGWEIREVL